MRVYLKIKVMSLASEARIIRREEKRWPGPSDQRTGLHLHRIHAVRPESRAAHLAYGFLRGRAYRQMEATCRREPDWNKVQHLAIRYGDGDKNALSRRIAEWIEAAKAAAPLAAAA